jgi:hypothetical protein
MSERAPLAEGDRVPALDAGRGQRVSSAAVALIIILFASVLWPEPSSPAAILALVGFSIGCAVLLPPAPFAYTVTSFVGAMVTAFLVYGATASKGLFVTDYQEGLVSDSQYFLFCAQEFSQTLSVDALMTTWGSLAPVLFGGLALLMFGNTFIGIVLLNSLLYGLSIHILARQLGHDGRAPALAGLVACVLPLQLFYTSMLAKEPIYLFLCSLAVYFIGLLALRKSAWRNLAALAAILVALFFFRPIGAFILGGIALSVLFRTRQRAALAVFGSAVTAGLLVFFGVASGSEIPLVLLTSEGTFTLQQQLEVIDRFAREKEAVGAFAPLFTPPVSILLAPVLAAIWLVAPFPLLGASLESLGRILATEFSFQDLATVARGLDSMVIVLLLIVLVRRWRGDPRGLLRRIVDQPALLFTGLSVLGIAAFQFLESGRHRYAVTPVLLLFASWRKGNRGTGAAGAPDAASGAS